MYCAVVSIWIKSAYIVPLNSYRHISFKKNHTVTGSLRVYASFRFRSSEIKKQETKFTTRSVFSWRLDFGVHLFFFTEIWILKSVNQLVLVWIMAFGVCHPFLTQANYNWTTGHPSPSPAPAVKACFSYLLQASKHIAGLPGGSLHTQLTIAFRTDFQWSMPTEAAMKLANKSCLRGGWLPLPFLALLLGCCMARVRGWLTRYWFAIVRVV